MTARKTKKQTQTIIGLGSAACKIAEAFDQYSQYKILKIDTDVEDEKNCFKMPQLQAQEAYEKKCPVIKLRAFLKSVKKDVLFITSCGDISGAALRILEFLNKKCDISVLYVKPDQNLLSQAQELQENLVFRVLQEYARSGVFKRMYVVSNAALSDVVGDVAIKKYHDSINEIVASTIHMINIFKNTESVMDTFSESVDTVRICTFGLVNYDTGKEKMFFSLDNVRNKRYYYGIPEDKLEKDATLLNNIKKQVKNKLEHDKMDTMYGLYTTQYDDIYSYCVASASAIQINKPAE